MPAARLAAATLWEIWCASGRPEIDQLLRRGTEATERGDLLAAEALFKVGDAEFALGQFVDAIGDYQRLISTYPDTKLIDRGMFQLGQAYQRTHNAEGAVHVFESLVQQYPQSEAARRIPSAPTSPSSAAGPAPEDHK